MRPSERRRVVRPAVAGAAMVLVALAAGCGGGAGDGDSESMSAGSGEVAGGSARSAQAPEPAAGDTAAQGLGREAEGDRSAPGGANRPAVQTRAVIRKGEISLVTKEMNRARAEIDDLLALHGGYLASEDTTNDRAGRPERSVLVVRVPEPAFDATMNELSDIGRTERADRSSEDVTTQVIDVDTRVATQEASLARLQRFLRQATNVDDMIRLESEIATRQAELESLKAQQKYLSDQTSMSTVTVRLRTPAAPPPPPVEDESGFLAGLEDGWHALKTVLVGTATVTGALLPFALTLALLGVPAWLVLRAAARRRQNHAAPPVAPEPS